MAGMFERWLDPEDGKGLNHHLFSACMAETLNGRYTEAQMETTFDLDAGELLDVQNMLTIFPGGSAVQQAVYLGTQEHVAIMVKYGQYDKTQASTALGFQLQ